MYHTHRALLDMGMGNTRTGNFIGQGQLKKKAYCRTGITAPVTEFAGNGIMQANATEGPYRGIELLERQI